MVRNLKHFTYARIVFEIVETGLFQANGADQHYDGGMNLLGILGKTSNTQPRGEDAWIICSWPGAVSQPLSPDDNSPKVQNVLMDYNGSGRHFPNTDPRYLLPNGSSGLKVDDIGFGGNEKLLEGWCYYKGGIFASMYKYKFFHSALLWCAKRHVADIQERCKVGAIELAVKYVPRM